MNLDELQELFGPINEDENVKWSDKGKSHHLTTYEEQEVELSRFNNADTDVQMIYLKVGDLEWEYSQGSEEFDFISNQIDNIKWSN
jgi:hypothetical protein